MTGEITDKLDAPLLAGQGQNTYALKDLGDLPQQEAKYRVQIRDDSQKKLKIAYHTAAIGAYIPETFFALFAYFATNLGFQVIASSYAENNASGEYSPTQKVAVVVALVTSFADFLVNLAVIHPAAQSAELSGYLRKETTYEGVVRLQGEQHQVLSQEGGSEGLAEADSSAADAAEKGQLAAAGGGAVAATAEGAVNQEKADAILAGRTPTEEIQGVTRLLTQIFPIFLGYVAGTLGNLLFLAQDKEESPSFLQGLVGKMQEYPALVWGLAPPIMVVGCVYYAMYSYTRMLVGTNVLANGEYGNRKNISGSMEAWLENLLASTFRGTGFGAITEIFFRSANYTGLSDAWKWPLYGLGTFLGVTNTFLRSIPGTHKRYIGSEKVLTRIAASETSYYADAKAAYNDAKTFAGMNQTAVFRTLPFSGIGFMTYFLMFQHLDESKLEHKLVSAGVAAVVGFAVLALRFMQAREMETMRIARAYASADLHNEAVDWCAINHARTIQSVKGSIEAGDHKQAKAVAKQYDDIAGLRDAYAKEAGPVLNPKADPYQPVPDGSNLLSSVSRCLSIILGLTYVFNAFDDPRAAVSVSLPFMIMATVLNYNYNKDDARESWDGIKPACCA